ncbi:MAG: ABC transporter substrate-binding protein [Thermoproteota archaeon]
MFTVLLLCLTVFPLFLPAASSPASSPEETVEGLPRNETLIMTDTGVPTIFDSFNPFIPNGYQGSYGEDQLLIERLFYRNFVTGERIYWLCTGYNHSQDFKTWTFYLRRGVTWNDGTPFTSKDVAFTVNMFIANPALTYHTFYSEWVENVSTPDNYTVVFHLTKPSAAFDLSISGGLLWNLMVVPEHIWKGKDPATFKNNPPVFTGPYKLLRVDPQKKMFIWVRRDDYWGKELGYFPKPKYIIWEESPAPDVEAMELTRNQIDHAHSITLPLMVSLSETDKNITLAKFWDLSPKGIWVNCMKYPLNLSEVRWAISYCINREKLSKILWAPIESIPAVSPFSVYGNLKRFVDLDVLKEYNLTYDPAKAEKILDDLGFKKGPDGIRVTPNGTRLSFVIITPVSPGGPENTIALDLAQELTKIGIEATVKVLPWATWSQLTSTGEFDLASQAMWGPPNDPREYYGAFFSNYSAPIGKVQMAGAWCRLKDPEFDKVIYQLDALSPDDPKAVPVYKKGLEIYMRDLPVIPVVQTPIVVDFNNAYWTGWPTNDNLYIQPFTSWPSFLFIIFKLKPVQAVVTLPPTLPPGLMGNITAIKNQITNLSGQVTRLSDKVTSLESTLGTIMGISAITVLAVIAGIVLMLIRKK